MIERLDRAFIAALASIVAAYLVLFGYFIGATTIRVPVYDLMGWIMHYADFWLPGDWWGYLWIPHNEHRILFSRILLLADIDWFGGTTLPFLLFGLLCLAAMVVVIESEVAKADLDAGARATLGLIVLLLLATTYIVVDCTMPALGVYVQTAAFATLSLVWFDGAGEGGRSVTLRRCLALLAGVGAGFGIAAGLLVWPVMVWAAWRGGLGRGWLLIVTALGAGLIAVYIPGLHSHGSLGSLDPLRLLRMLDYSLRFLGLPWSHAAGFVWFGRMIGAAILGAGLFLLLRRGLLSAPRSRLERIGLGMLFFALLMAALAGVGRVDIATDRAMPIRYSIFTAMAQLGLLFAIAPWLGHMWSQLGGRRALQAAILGAAVILLAQQVVAGRAGAAVAGQYAEAYRRFSSGLWAPEMTQFVNPDRAVADRGQAIVRQLGIYQSY